MCGGIPSSGEPLAGAPPRALFISMAVCMFIVCFAVLLVTAFAFWCRRQRSNSTADIEFGNNASAAAECSSRRQQAFPVETLPAFTFARDSDGSGGARECPVCLGGVREGEMVRRLPACKHVYHVGCIDPWLAAHRTCPLCRSELDDPCKVETDHSVVLVPVQGEPPDQPNV